MRDKRAAKSKAKPAAAGRKKPGVGDGSPAAGAGPPSPLPARSPGRPVTRASAPAAAKPKGLVQEAKEAYLNFGRSPRGRTPAQQAARDNAWLREGLVQPFVEDLRLLKGALGKGRAKGKR